MVDGGQEISCGLVVATGDGAELFEFAKEIFDQVARLVNPCPPLARPDRRADPRRRHPRPDATGYGEITSNQRALRHPRRHQSECPADIIGVLSIAFSSTALNTGAR